MAWLVFSCPRILRNLSVMEEFSDEVDDITNLHDVNAIIDACVLE